MSGGKKIVHELSVDDLMKLVSESTEPIVVDKISDASRFIYALNIKHGDIRVSAAVIFQAYKAWKGWDQKYQAKTYFFRDFSKYFPSVRTKDGMCYLLNPTPFDLSQEHYFQLRASHRREKAIRKREETKKQSKKSGSDQEV